jgi:hypothetical protein
MLSYANGTVAWHLRASVIFTLLIVENYKVQGPQRHTFQLVSVFKVKIMVREKVTSSQELSYFL